MSTIEATWPALGTLVSIDITGRNGYGEWGGRVTTMTLVGTDHDVSLTGDAFAGALGLKSDWFTTNATLGAPAVGMAATPSGAGYRLAGSNGAVAVFGDAGFSGSADGLALTRPVVGMAATPDGTGLLAGGLRRRHLQLRRRPLLRVDRQPSPSTSRWWAWPPPPTAGATGRWPPTAASSAIGDARFYGSTGAIPLNQPVVGMAATPDGRGYWLVAADGGIFAFGDASFYGSTGAIPLNQPVVGMAATPDGRGYWLVASDGGIFAFGDAGFYGSTGNIALTRPVVGMASAARGQGYWMVASDGGIFAFGDARFYGSAAG